MSDYWESKVQPVCPILERSMLLVIGPLFRLYHYIKDHESISSDFFTN